MARLKASLLSNKQKRLSLDQRQAPYYEILSGGVSIGYRRNQAAGSWVARRYDDGARRIGVLGVADDFQDADGLQVLTYSDACKMALTFNPKREEAKVVAAEIAAQVQKARITVSRAMDMYEADLAARQGDVYNCGRLRRHVDAEFSQSFVSDLIKAECREWRDGLLNGDEMEGKGLARATVDRLCNCLRAALNLAADHAPAGEIVSREPWEWGLKALGGAQQARNVILETAPIKALIDASYGVHEPFGLLMEVAAVTGARFSQIARLLARDLIGGIHDPKLLMPRSMKGKAGKDLTPYPVPITLSLAAKLRAEIRGHAPDGPLLLKQALPPTNEEKKAGITPARRAWGKDCQHRPFAYAIEAAFWGQAVVGGYAVDEITMYALRHSSIVRQLLASVPIRVVASQHDTSVGMIEKHYSAYISNHADSLVRGALQSF